MQEASKLLLDVNAEDDGRHEAAVAAVEAATRRLHEDLRGYAWVGGCSGAWFLSLDFLWTGVCRYARLPCQPSCTVRSSNGKAHCLHAKPPLCTARSPPTTRCASAASTSPIPAKSATPSSSHRRSRASP